MFCFYAGLGLYVARTADASIVPLIVACGILARVAVEAACSQVGWFAAVASAGIVYAQLIYTAAKAGPYS